MDETKIKFRRKVMKVGNSLAITLPEEIIEYNNIQLGDEIILLPDKNKHDQKYTAIWKDEIKKEE